MDIDEGNIDDRCGQVDHNLQPPDGELAVLAILLRPPAEGRFDSEGLGFQKRGTAFQMRALADLTSFSFVA